MPAARKLDIIDVNRCWSVWVGSRRWGYRIGTVHASDRILAMRAAKERWPETRIGFVNEEPA
jgi:hypothetical protein